MLPAESYRPALADKADNRNHRRRDQKQRRADCLLPRAHKITFYARGNGRRIQVVLYKQYDSRSRREQQSERKQYDRRRSVLVTQRGYYVFFISEYTDLSCRLGYALGLGLAEQSVHRCIEYLAELYQQVDRRHRPVVFPLADALARYIKLICERVLRQAFFFPQRLKIFSECHLNNPSLS